MGSPEGKDSRAQFPTTSWTIVLNAGLQNSGASDDMGVVEPSQCVGFAQKAFDEAWIARATGRKNLDRYEAVKSGLSGLVDGRHAAAAEQRSRLEVAVSSTLRKESA
jgi:hypothetical protein